MNINRLTVIVLIVAVALAGCSGLGPMAGSSTPSPDETTQPATTQTTTTSDTTPTQSTAENTETSSSTQTSTATTTPTQTSTPTQSTAENTETSTATATPTKTSTPQVVTPRTEPTSTPTEPWTEPQPPKSPEDKGVDRIDNVKFVNKEKASSGSGYTDFDVRVSANTMMEGIDPPPSEDGEPYIYVEINGQPIAREEVGLRTTGVFTIDIRPAALEQFDSGTLQVTVTLYDDDHKHHDEYGTWTNTIQYTAPDAGSNSNSSESQ